MVGSGEAHDPLLGATVGAYRIDAVLGVGGMARVYRGVHPTIGSLVAIKVLSIEHAARGDLVDRFFAEAKVVNTIHHENIVNVLDLDVLPDGRPYIVMEHLPGAPLNALVERATAERTFLPFGGVVRLVGEVLDGLAAAHATGVVHRDLKPDNIFVSPQGRPKILDFGIAKLGEGLAGSATRTGSLLGTPYYMSPEQCAGQPVDLRADLYALGIILFECATNQRPFTSTSLFDILRMHVDAPIPSVRALRGDLPVEVEHVITCALAKEPARRFATARAMSAALQHASQTLPAAAWAPLAPATSPRVAAPASDLGRAPTAAAPSSDAHAFARGTGPRDAGPAGAGLAGAGVAGAGLAGAGPAGAGLAGAGLAGAGLAGAGLAGAGLHGAGLVGAGVAGAGSAPVVINGGATARRARWPWNVGIGVAVVGAIGVVVVARGRGVTSTRSAVRAAGSDDVTERPVTYSQIAPVDAGAAGRAAVVDAMVDAAPPDAHVDAAPPIDAGEFEDDGWPVGGSITMPGFDGKSVEVMRVVDFALGYVKLRLPDVKLMRFGADAVTADGVAHFDVEFAGTASPEVSVQLFSAHARDASGKAAGPGLSPGNRHCWISINVRAPSRDNPTGVTLTGVDSVCADEHPVPMPKCSAAQIWAQRIRDGAPANGYANVDYYAPTNDEAPRWSLDVPSITPGEPIYTAWGVDNCP